MNYTIYLALEPYLAQWMIHESGEYPIKVKRGSAEADILECYLTTQPKNLTYVPQTSSGDGEVDPQTLRASHIVAWQRTRHTGWILRMACA